MNFIRVRVCRHDNNPNLCNNADSCKPPNAEGKSKLAVYVAVPVVLVVVIIPVIAVLFLFLRQKRQGDMHASHCPALAFFFTP